MKKLIADMHTHTIASGHAYGTIREMAEAASAQKLDILGLTEHAPGIPGTADPFYFLNLKVIPRRIHGVKILHGCEINVLDGGKLSLKQRFIEKLDYASVGIHRPCYADQGRDKNTENLIQCMKHEKVCFVTHPDDDHTPLDYERLVRAAKEFHVALEVNNSSLNKPEKRWNCHENYRSMLRLCDHYRVPILINSDAHDPSSVGDFEQAEALIDALNFDESLILNNEAGKLMDFIGCRDLTE